MEIEAERTRSPMKVYAALGSPLEPFWSFMKLYKRPKMAQNCTKRAQERPKICPREAQDGPKRPPRWAQEGPREAQERPKMAPREPKRAL